MASEEVGEVERVLGYVSRLPPPLQPLYASFLPSVGIELRLAVLRFLHVWSFDPSTCSTFLDVSRRIAPKITLLSLIGILESFDHDPSIFLKFLSALNEENLMAILSKEHSKDCQLIQTLFQFLSESQRLLLIHHINTFDLNEFLSQLYDVQVNKRIKCSLCRLKRLRALEDRLLHNEVPDAVMPVPGTLPMYSPNYDAWKNPDYSDFSVKYVVGDRRDIEDASVYYNSSLIDFTIICDSCLHYVYEAICTRGRHVEFYHLEPEHRTAIRQQLRSDEVNLTFLLEKLSKERLKRRAREFCVEAVLQMQRGLKEERDERDLKEKNRLLAEEEQRLQSERHEVIGKSSQTLEKWRMQEERSLAAQLKKRAALAAMTYHPSFGGRDMECHMSASREHPLSWRLSHFERGAQIDTPLSAEAATDVFGTAKYIPSINLKDLSGWKETMQTAMVEHEAREAERQRLHRSEELATYERHVSYVDERLQSLERRSHRKRMDGLITEEQRLASRHRDKANRRLARLRAAELRESELMGREDDRSCQLRRYHLEQRREEHELGLMRRQEKAQTRVDRFWGIDEAERVRRDEERRRRLAYEALVDKYRELCVMAKITR